jgi:flagellar basal-body rod protein FlgB
MIDALFSQPDYLAAKKVLDATVLRQDAIASNLANLETPNYKRIDIAASFETQLQQAIAGKDTEQMNNIQPQLAVDTTAMASRTDGNTVQLEDELLKMNQNTVENTLGTQLVNNSLYQMRMAITGKS